MNVLTQPCPACGGPVEFDRRIPICQPCWEQVPHLQRINVINTWENRNRSDAHKRCIEAAVRALKEPAL